MYVWYECIPKEWMLIFISYACMISVSNTTQYVDFIHNLINHEESKDMWISFRQYTTQLDHTFQDMRAYDIHVLMGD